MPIIKIFEHFPQPTRRPEVLHTNHRNMSPPLSRTVRQIVWFQLGLGKDDRFILERTGISARQMRKMRQIRKKFGEVVRPQMAAGRPKKMSQIHNQTLLEHLEQRSTAYQDEMVWFLWDKFSLVDDESTICRTLRRLSWSWKKVVRKVKQQSQALKDECMIRLSGWKADQLVFFYESAASERTGEYHRYLFFW